MQKKLSFEDIDYILSHQKKVKLPDRRFLHVWDSFDVQNFRGFNEDAEEYEKNRNQAIRRAVEIREAASADLPTANAEFFNQRAQAANQMEDVLQQQQQNFDQMAATINAGMRAEREVMFEAFNRGQREMEERARVIQQMQQRHIDTAEADRQMMMGFIGQIGQLHAQVLQAQQQNAGQGNIQFIQQRHVDMAAADRQMMMGL